jgi:hypothetical protein
MSSRSAINRIQSLFRQSSMLAKSLTSMRLWTSLVNYGPKGTALLTSLSRSFELSKRQTSEIHLYFLCNYSISLTLSQITRVHKTGVHKGIILSTDLNGIGFQIFSQEIGWTHMRILEGVGTLIQLGGLMARLCKLVCVPVRIM